jgi:hypothetical protein
MKTRFFSVVVSLVVVMAAFFVPKNGYSQRSSSFNNDIGLDFVDQFIQNVITIQYEFKSTSTSSFAVRGHFVTNVGGTTGFGAGATWRFYVADSRALAGWNVGPAADIYSFKNNDLGKTNILIGIGADAAYKWFFGNFTVEPFVGARIGFTGSDVIAGVNNFSGFHPLAGIYLGWSW